MADPNQQNGDLGHIFAGPLKQGLERHLEETRGHVRRIEDVFSGLGQQPEAATCQAIDGIIEAGEASVRGAHGPGELDAVVAAAAQVVEHYEIARYGTLVAWTEQMHRPELAETLRATLAEEKAADRKLTEIAESRLNRAA